MNSKVLGAHQMPPRKLQKSACPKRHHTIESKRLTSKHLQTERKEFKAEKLPQPCQSNISKHTRSLRPIPQTSFLSQPLPHSSSPRLARRRSESIQPPLEATSTLKTPPKKTLSRRSRYLKKRILLAVITSALQAKAAYLQAWASKAM
jgi:hypothetical protein